MAKEMLVTIQPLVEWLYIIVEKNKKKWLRFLVNLILLGGDHSIPTLSE
jgi:hypothetical protein